MTSFHKHPPRPETWKAVEKFLSEKLYHRVAAETARKEDADLNETNISK